MHKLALALATTALTAGFSAQAADMATVVDSLLNNQVAGWLNQPTVIDAINAQNAKHVNLSQDEITALDQQWRAEVNAANKPLVDDVLSNSLSQYLNNVFNGGAGLYTEIFVMDNKGLNVGQSHPTSDYWQGDEAKFQQTYTVGADAVHLSEVEFDESSQSYQIQVSVPVVVDGAPIGAATIGMDAEQLLSLQ